MSRLVVLPSRGTLVAATDLHGNLFDFHAVVARFLALSRTRETYLVICGDLVHGPAIAEGDWPEHLGSYYRDETKELLAEARSLQQQYEGRVHYLLGNHEHAHLGGPRLDKFHSDEASSLESQYAPGDFEPIRQWMRGWPLAVLAGGIVLTHAAPHASINAASDLDAVRLDGYEDVPLHEMAATGPLGALLWARTTTTERAMAFLHTLAPSAEVAVFGHDPIREGHIVEREPLLCLSTSFACFDADKEFLEWDLASPPLSAAHVAATGLRHLYPGVDGVDTGRAIGGDPRRSG